MTFTETSTFFGVALCPAATLSTGKPGLRSARPLLGISKVCSRCGTPQDLSEFAIKRGSRAAHCRSCQKAISDAHYQKNRQTIITANNERSDELRDVMRGMRDTYLGECICENCASTVDLQITTRDEYEGLSVHEVIAGALGFNRMEESLVNSRVLCRPCMGNMYGLLGAPMKAQLHQARAAAAPRAPGWPSRGLSD